MIEWIRKHQLATFFILAFLLTWGLSSSFWLLHWFIGDQLRDFHAGRIITQIGGFGPALAAVIISRVTSHQSVDNPKWKRRITFWITWLIATIIFVFIRARGLIEIVDPMSSFFLIVLLSGVLPALMWSAGFSKYPNVRRMLTSLVIPRGRFLYYILAITIPIVIKIALVPIEQIKSISFFSNPAANESLPLIGIYLVMSFLYILLFGAGVAEEIGWSGFATPQLQNKYSPLLASLILSIFWVAWHIPGWIAQHSIYNEMINSPELMSGATDNIPSAWELTISLIITLFFLRIIMVWLLNKTQGSILPAMIFHASYNFSLGFNPSATRKIEFFEPIIYAVIAIIVVISSKMWMKLPAMNSANSIVENS